LFKRKVFSGKITDHAGCDKIFRIVPAAQSAWNDVIDGTPERPESSMTSNIRGLIPTDRAGQALVNPPSHFRRNHTATAVAASPSVASEYYFAERGFGCERWCALLFRDRRQQVRDLAHAVNTFYRRSSDRLVPHVEEGFDIGLIYQRSRFVIAADQEHLRSQV